MKKNIVVSISLMCSIGCGYIENPDLMGDDVGSSSDTDSTSADSTTTDSTSADSTTSDSTTSDSTTTDSTTTDSSDSTEGIVEPPEAPVLDLSVSPIKQFVFAWEPVRDAEYYQLFESANPNEPFMQVGADLVGEATSLTVPLHFRANASYRLAACNALGCSDSEIVQVADSLAAAVGYFKASNTDEDDQFGHGIALSADGSTLAVGAPDEASSAVGIGGNLADDSAAGAGAVYIFEQNDEGQWMQTSYVKASNTDAGDGFGASVVLSADGSTLAVGAHHEDSNATGINGNQSDLSTDTGAVYVFERDGQGQWMQTTYLKASNTDAGDGFGWRLALSADGTTIAVGAELEDGGTMGIGGNPADDSAIDAGAVYVFERDGQGPWAQTAYVKASNTDAGDQFGTSVALSGDGGTLAVGALSEDSSATGIAGNQASDSAIHSGAVYVFERNGQGQWAQTTYVKASNTDVGDRFGASVALSLDGIILAVGAHVEASNAMGIDGNQADDSAIYSGAVYVFEREGQGPWSQAAYVKASNSGGSDRFGWSVALSPEGSTLAVGAHGEASSAVGVDGNQADEEAFLSGAVYVFERTEQGQWSQAAYVKASNTRPTAQLGWSVALSEYGSTLAVGANGEASNAAGIGGDQDNSMAFDAGAVYLY